MPKELEEKLEQEVYEYEERQPMELLSRLELRAIQRGEQIGLEKGLKKGREEGIGHVVSHQLPRLFGPLDAKTQAKLRRMSIVQMENLGAALLDFATVKDLKSWLAQQETATPKQTTTKPRRKAKCHTS